MKKWNNAELVTLDINMTANGNNKTKTEGDSSMPGKSEKTGRPNNNQDPQSIIDEVIEVIDNANKSDVNATS